MNRTEGLIATWIPDRAFGFLVTEEKEVRRFFFHITNVPEEQIGLIAVGQRVTFTIDPIKKGKCFSADNVEIVMGGAA
jgi:cold shock CspA family protein